MDLDKQHNSLISLKELFPVQSQELKNLPISMILQKEKDAPFYVAKIANPQAEESMGKTHIFPLFVDALSGKGQIPNLNPSIIHEFEKTLSLAFLPEKLPGPNVCFANSEEVRPEFKSTFTSIDIFDYLLAVLNSHTSHKNHHNHFHDDLPLIAYPKDDLEFWKLVELGRRHR